MKAGNCPWAQDEDHEDEECPCYSKLGKAEEALKVMQKENELSLHQWRKDLDELTDSKQALKVGLDTLKEIVESDPEVLIKATEAAKKAINKINSILEGK